VASVFFLFTLLPFLELWLLVRIGRLLGAPSILAYVIAMIFVGAWLARTQGRRVLEASRASLEQGRVPEGGLLEGVLVLLGGVLLMVPGVISDVLGLLCLLPPTRRLIGARLQRALAERIATGTLQVQQYGVRWPPGGAAPGRPGGDFIDTVGEDVSDSPSEPKRLD
jgi:UPF0716 protein FxsA